MANWINKDTPTSGGSVSTQIINAILDFGQSNRDGVFTAGIGTIQPPYDTTVYPNIKYLALSVSGFDVERNQGATYLNTEFDILKYSNNFTKFENLEFNSINQPNGYPYGAEYSRGANLIGDWHIVKCARGGTSLSTEWNTYQTMRVLAIERIKYLKTQGTINRLVLNWDQWESSMNNSNYTNDFISFVTDIENTCGVTIDLIIIAKPNPLSNFYSTNIMNQCDGILTHYNTNTSKTAVYSDRDSLGALEGGVHYVGSQQVAIGIDDANIINNHYGS